MFAKTAALAILLATAGAAAVAEVKRPSAAGGVSLAEFASQCAGKNGWDVPAPPARIHGQTFYVGTCGITAVLIASPAGHVLIDGAVAEAAPHIAANIERLGFRMRDVKLLLSTHEHHDHVGGLAELQRRSGAPLRASPAATPVMASGKIPVADPQFGLLPNFTPVRMGKPLRDGEIVRVGPTRLTAHLTPGRRWRHQLDMAVVQGPGLRKHRFCRQRRCGGGADLSHVRPSRAHRGFDRLHGQNRVA